MHARFVFFSGLFEAGLALVRQCEHEDARLLASLFPGDAPASMAEASAVFALREEARCMTWVAMTGDWDTRRVQQAAEGGCGWAQMSLAQEMRGEARLVCMEWAVAQGERGAMLLLSNDVCLGRDCEKDQVRGKALVLEAALLGDSSAQKWFADSFCDDSTPEYFVAAAIRHSMSGSELRNRSSRVLRSQTFATARRRRLWKDSV